MALMASHTKGQQTSAGGNQQPTQHLAESPIMKKEKAENMKKGKAGRKKDINEGRQEERAEGRKEGGRSPLSFALCPLILRAGVGREISKRWQEEHVAKNSQW